jgi:hypothetical protein
VLVLPQKTVKPGAPAGRPLVELEYVRATISPLALLTGKLEVWRVQADGIELNIERSADGKLPAIDHLIETAGLNKPADAKPAAASAAKGSDKPAAIDLSAPLTVDAFRLQHVRLNFIDNTVKPALETTIRLDLRVSDIGVAGKPARLEMEVACDPLLDVLRVEGEARSSGAALDAQFHMALRGLHAKPRAQFIEPLGIRPLAESISATANGRLTTTAAGLAKAAADLIAATRPTTASTQSSPATKASPATQATPADPVFAHVKPAESLACKLTLSNLSLWADEQEVASCRSVTVDATKLNAATAEVASIIVEGVRGRAARSERGRLRVAGFELVPVASSGAASTVAEPPAKPTPATTPAKSGKPFTASLGLLALRDVRLSFDDRWAAPDAPLTFEVVDLSVRDIVFDPAKPDAPLKVDGQFKVPGVARAMRLSGSAKPFAERKTLDLKFAASGVAPTLPKPYLDMAGLESLLLDAAFQADLSVGATIDPSGAVLAEARLGKIDFVDGGKHLLTLDDVRFSGVRFDPVGGTLRLESVDVRGPRVDIRRTPEGSLAGFGFQTKTPTPAPPRDPDPPSPPSAIELGRLEIGRFTWKDVKFRFDDQVAQPPQSVDLADAGVELTDAVLDLRGHKFPPKPGKLKAFMKAPGLADELGVTGTLMPATDRLVADLSVFGSGITAKGISGYLQTLGIEPTLKDGSLAAQAKLTAALVDGAVKASVYLDDVRYADAGNELAGVDLLYIDEIIADPAKLTLAIGTVHIGRPRAQVQRDADGVLSAGGFRLVGPATKPATPATGEAVAAAPAEAAPTPPVAGPAVAGATPPPAATPADAAAATQPAAPVLTLRSLNISEAAIGWTDLAAREPVRTTLHSDVLLSGLTLGKEASPASLFVRARGDGLFGEARIGGHVTTHPRRLAVDLTIGADDVRGTALAPYLPPGIELKLQGGRFAAGISAAVDQLQAGGMGLKLLIDQVDWRDRASAAPLFALDRVDVDIPRFDPDGGVIAINKISVTGTELEAIRLADGTLELLGLGVGPAPQPAAAPDAADKPAEAAAVAVVPAAAPAAAQPANPPAAAAAIARPATQPAGPTVNAATLVARARQAMPLVTLKTLDLNLRRLSLTDLSQPGALPLSVTDLRLRNTAPIELLGKQPEQNPPVVLALTGKADPIVGNLDVKLHATPFATQPLLTADVAVTGIRGQGITEVMPALAEKLDGSALAAGEFRTNVELTLANLDRRAAGKINWMSGFDADLVVSKIAFRETADQPVAIGLDELRVEKAVVRPTLGTVKIKSIELTKPIASAVRDEQGVRVAGLLVKMPKNPAPVTQPTPDSAGLPTESVPASPPAEPVVAQASATAPVATPATPPQKPEGEIAIGRVVVTGAEVRIEDRSVTPPVLVPITSIDVDARGISSLAMYEEKPINFSTSLNAGKVPLPKKVKGGLIGAAGDLLNLAGGQKVEAAPESEDRELFAQVTASGSVVLYPATRGRVKADVSGFELAGVSGLAREAGVTLGYGTFDIGVEARAPGDGSVQINARPSITDLSVKEPPGGPIMRFIGPITPDLDSAIFALESADKSITLPIDVTVRPKEGKQIGPDDISGIGSSISGAVSSVIAKAVISSPVKAVTGVTSLVGLDALIPGAGPAKPEEPIVITFPAGHAGLEPAEAARLSALAARLRGDAELSVRISADLGAADLTVAEGRANPTRDDASALAVALRQRRQELNALRSEAAAEARVRMAAAGDVEAAAALDRLRAIERELARTEDGLDRAYDLLRPGADRQAPRRTRAAALDLSRDRVGVVRQMLLGAIPPGGDPQRVKAEEPRVQVTGDGGGTITVKIIRVKQQ